ncbi:PGC [Symbiodinium natans]|uniref:PGC protein n=1 Tax=Symbiodinium natans TaxID=878477 RepID=A0A812J534_9DINO|nr:PGC [Symbiodinium natans]
MTMLRHLVSAALAITALAMQPQDMEALPADDVCDGEECSLSLRQLRGLQSESPVAEHNASVNTSDSNTTDSAADVPTVPTVPTVETSGSNSTETGKESAEESEAPQAPVTANTPVQIYVPDPSETIEPSGADDEGETISKVNETLKQDEREKEEGGSCCFSGESSKDTCGTCYPMSIASYKSKCSRKVSCLGECAGTWCPTKCVMSAADPGNMCGTAFPKGTAVEDSFCASSKDACKSCKGEWCRAGHASNFKVEEDSYGREENVYVPPEDTNGFCCYRGNTSAAEGMCGACADVAKDETCSEKTRCGGCGGTWCPGPKCVKAYKDEANPCGSAYPLSGIAAADDYCSLNEKQCASCKGSWCPISNITYSDGTKYDPNEGWHAHGDQRLTPENATATAEAEEEVENDDTISDLFPDGLADHGVP